MIYRSLIKNGYSNFKLENLEYCDLYIVVEREQYYLYSLNPEYNILKVAAGCLIGFKHSEAIKEAMTLSKNNNLISEETRLIIATTFSKG
ncbi:GIY-YIG endonuclease (mitochondrion) protein [Rutstroemia sp. NJR-2017a WRK4]|jgi:group I intron endonuclease|nr:GIY-YIG endonuclease (mitochondrion) protein [Rutstroemia sp. NJR-2017a WRK4]